MRLDLIDEFHVNLFPCVAGEGTRLFDDAPKSYQLELVSSTAWSNGMVGGRREDSGHGLVGGAAHDVRVCALVTVE